MHKILLFVVCFTMVFSGSPISAAPAHRAAPDLLSCPSDPYEPNPTFETARQVGAGNHIAYICPEDDADWFQFNVSIGTQIQLYLTGSGGGELPADFDMLLYNPSSGLAGASQNGGTATEQISTTALMSGWYRVLVAGYNHAASTTPYRLSIVLQAPTPTATATTACPPDSYEPNGSYNAARQVNPGTHTAYICPAGDED